MGWLASNNRKRHQRRMNSYVRKINKIIANDTLWNGRFYIRQKRSSFYHFEDNSGSELYVELEFIDKKTGFSKTYVESVNHFCMYECGRLGYLMNEFITKNCEVWSNDDPYSDKTNYNLI